DMRPGRGGRFVAAGRGRGSRRRAAPGVPLRACGAGRVVLDGSWRRVVAPGRGAVSWRRGVAPGRGGGSWCRIVAPGRGAGSWRRVVVPDRGAGSWCRIVAPGRGGPGRGRDP